MRRVLSFFSCTVLLCLTAPFLLSQGLDWAKIFEDAVVRDRAINDRARNRMFTNIMPKLLNEEPSLVAAEIPKIAQQLNRKEAGIRQQASGIILVLAQFRPDSASVLSSAFPALRDHVQDLEPRIRTNSLSALCFLRPDIPPEQLEFLIHLMEGKDESSAYRAAFGVARMADLRSDAAGAIDKALSQNDSPGRKIAAIQALGAAHVMSENIVSRLGTVLTDRDTMARRAALQAISALGVPAIRANLTQLNQLAATSSDSELVVLSRRLIERQSSVQ